MGGYKLVRIDADILAEMLRYDGIGRQETFTAKGLPKDAKIVSFHEDVPYNRLLIKVWSSEFKETDYGALLDVLKIDLTVQWFGKPQPDPVLHPYNGLSR